MLELGERIYNLRKRSALSQEEFADRLGVSRQAVSKWETGQSVPDSEKAAAMAKFFGVSIDYLLGGAEQKDSLAPEGERVVRDEEIRAAFFGGADDDLTEEEMDAMWHDAKDYIQYKLEQRRRLKHG